MSAKPDQVAEPNQTYTILADPSMVKVANAVSERRAQGWEPCGGMTYGQVATTETGSTQARLTPMWAQAMQLPRELWPELVETPAGQAQVIKTPGRDPVESPEM